MEEKEEKEAGLFKVRSYSSCIAEGFVLPLKNFKLLVKYLWPSLLVAMVSFVWMTFEIERVTTIFLYQVNPLHVVLQDRYVWGALLLLFLFAILANSLYTGQLIALIKMYGKSDHLSSVTFKKMNTSIWKSTARYFIYLVLTMLFYLGCAGISWLLFGFSAWSISTVLVLIVVLLIPFIMIGLQYCFGQSSLLGSFAAWKSGFRFWGAFFSILLVGGISTLVLGLFGSLPAWVLSTASAMAKLSELEGDVTELPEFFFAVKIFFYAVSAFVFLISVWFSFFPLAFLYGSIEKRRQEKKVYDAEQEAFLTSKERL